MEKRVGGDKEMAAFAAEYIADINPAASAIVLGLSGELGAGKTTFAQAVAKALGVEETVNSPTFVIEKIYQVRGQSWERLVHVDAYRLKGAAELYALGWDELIADPRNLIVIEWPENVESAIPKDAHRITIEISDSEARTITYGS